MGCGPGEAVRWRLQQDKKRLWCRTIAPTRIEKTSLDTWFDSSLETWQNNSQVIRLIDGDTSDVSTEGGSSNPGSLRMSAKIA
jgi:hypothetical protein